MTPVETPSHFTTWLDLFDHWLTVIAGVFALIAGFGTVVATMIIANRQIVASREEAAKVIAATREQTESTVRFERERISREAQAFRITLEAAMTRVLAEAAWARTTYPELFRPTTEAVSVEAGDVRNCITKGAFEELRAACVQQGSPLTGDFLYLEGEIDNFALQVGTNAFSGAVPMPVRKGKLAGLGEQLAVIETLATELRAKAARDPWGLTLPGRAEHGG